ncbi:MAG TPA: efflux RND transporter permease subunit [Isosphaeraceae bacterium]|jgi:Cu(I)/Ag(I) efflux system membrane protein CusA/SilA|nr:efflux RND transporter permease subunit [Isosphaeraceae bacterium]
MIDRIITASIEHPRTVVLAAIALAALGVFAAQQTPVDAIPDLSENQVIVFTDWPGHGPTEVEDRVSRPLSGHLQGIRGVRSVRSSSDVNYSMIHVIFEDSVPLPAARRLVAERLARAAADLPGDARPALGPDALATGQIFWYTVEGAGLDLGRLRAVQDGYVRPRLESVPGVAEVATVGGAPIEFQVNVAPLRLRALGVTLGEVVRAVSRSNVAAGGDVVEKGNAEYIVRGVGWLGAGGGDPTQVLRDLEAIPLAGGKARLADVAAVAIGPGQRRGVLEKDGNEAVGGVVLMASGENPLEVTRRLKTRLREIGHGLPDGVKVVPFYDRTPLIRGAIGTVTGTIVEAMLAAMVCVLLVLGHARASLLIAVMPPLAALTSFAVLWALRRLGLATVETNIMSLAGIAISVGVLVDSSIVVVENAMHRLRERFGDRPVRGDVRGVVLPACLTVGCPLVFSVLIMLLSFLPVFALGGMEGKMFFPLAATKTFALLASALLAITLVPALCATMLRGRIRGEHESRLVRGVVEVYRPVLDHLLDRPAPLAWLLGATFLVSLAPLGSATLSLAVLAGSLLAFGLTARGPWACAGGMAALVAIALAASSWMTPTGSEFMTPLDEGMLMDMPISVPRASATESADDLKARDMVLCRFPEVDMVVGKAGRAESPTDPAPLDMIETMVNFRPRAFWPRRRLDPAAAPRHAGIALEILDAEHLARPPRDRRPLIAGAVAEVVPVFDAQLREYAYQRNQELVRTIGLPEPLADDPGADGLDPARRLRWREHIRKLDAELLDRAPGVFARLIVEDLVARAPGDDATVVAAVARRREARSTPIAAPAPRSGHHHGGMAPAADLPEPVPGLDEAIGAVARRLAGRLILWKHDRASLADELDRAVPMPGWTNVWTMPIQNRVDMLATGVNTEVGVRVLGRDRDAVARASEAVAAALRTLPGAANVVADPLRGKGYLEVRLDRARAARRGVLAADVGEVVEVALGGKVATATVAGRERHAVRVRAGRAWRGDGAAVRDLIVTPVGAPPCRLGDVADVRVVEGPATIKGENGLLRTYVRLNVRGRDAAGFVAEARLVVADRVKLPDVNIEWTGQFEHQEHARRSLAVVLPAVVALILFILYWTYRDLADAALMLLAVPGALAGGVLVQWLLGYKFSVTVWVGYIACFGMATSTGIIMLVYLREAVDRAGGLGRLSREGLRRAVLDGAAHRLRPKLLTEGTTIVGLAPLLWADGPGAEVIRPMAAPVLGGLLVADEVIDLLLPVLFFHLRALRLPTPNPRPPTSILPVVPTSSPENEAAMGQQPG